MRHFALPPVIPAALTGGVFALFGLGALAPLTAQDGGGSGSADDYLELQVAAVALDLQTGAPLALLHAEWNDVLPIWIGEAEAAAIANAVQGLTPPRPMTHDLLASVVAALGGELEEVRVTELRETTYYGVLRIRTANGVEEVDTRPSDALALAVRTGARIMASRGLVAGAPDADFLSVEGQRSILRVRGITVGDPRTEDRREFNLGDAEGLMVLHAAGGMGPRGVRRGDLILEAEGEAVPSPREFLQVVGSVPRSSNLRVLVLRDGAEVEVEVTPPSGSPRIGP